MRRRRGGAGTPCDELRPPIPNAPSNRRSAVGPKRSPRVSPTRLRYRCPLCGLKALDVSPGRSVKWIYYCYACESGYPELVASGIPGYELAAGPPTELGEPVERARPRRAAAAVEPRLPSEGAVAGWVSRLASEGVILDYLHGRGLVDETIAWAELGYDGDRHAITIPIRDGDGNLVNVRRRFLGPDPDPKYMPIPGCGAQLYPAASLTVPTEVPIANCEGEFDSLILRQHGFTAFTSTAGIGGWAKHPEWLAHVRGRTVAILYDAGAATYELAERRSEEFREAGARDAWPVDLTLAGFRRGEDVTDWFVKYGWSANDLRAFLNATYRWYRSERKPSS